MSAKMASQGDSPGSSSENRCQDATAAALRPVFRERLRQHPKYAPPMPRGGGGMSFKDRGNGAMTLQDLNFGPRKHLQPAPRQGPRCSQPGAAKLKCRRRGSLASPVADSAA